MAEKKAMTTPPAEVYSRFGFESDFNDADYSAIKRCTLKGKITDENSCYRMDFHEKATVKFDKTSSISISVNSIMGKNMTDYIEFGFASHGPAKMVEVGFSFFFNDQDNDDEDDYEEVSEKSQKAQGADDDDSDEEESEKAEESDGDYEDYYYNITKEHIIANLGKISMAEFFDSEDIGPRLFIVQVVLKIPIETNSFIQGMSELHTTGNKFSDVNITCGGETFKCNKAILAARSGVFSAMFNMANSSENSTGAVKIDDIKDAKTMRALLQFIYEGRVAQEELSQELKIAAKKYDLPTLASRCRNNLKVQDHAPFKFETEYNKVDYSVVKRTTIRGRLDTIFEDEDDEDEDEGEDDEEEEEDSDIQPQIASTRLSLDKKTKIDVEVYNVEPKGMFDCLIMHLQSNRDVSDDFVKNSVEVEFAFSSSCWNFTGKPISAPLGDIMLMKNITWKTVRDLGRSQYVVDVIMKIPWDTQSCIKEIAQLLTTGKFSDVKLVCEEKTYKCHKAILAARSSHFAGMFKKSDNGVIQIDDINVNTLTSLLMYIYCNQISKRHVNPELIKASSKYKLSALTSQCKKILLHYYVPNILKSK